MLPETFHQLGSKYEYKVLITQLINDKSRAGADMTNRDFVV